MLYLAREPVHLISTIITCGMRLYFAPSKPLIAVLPAFSGNSNVYDLDSYDIPGDST
jgi:hypothetical protein